MICMLGSLKASNLLDIILCFYKCLVAYRVARAQSRDTPPILSSTRCCLSSTRQVLSLVACQSMRLFSGFSPLCSYAKKKNRLNKRMKLLSKRFTDPRLVTLQATFRPSQIFVNCLIFACQMLSTACQCLACDFQVFFWDYPDRLLCYSQNGWGPIATACRVHIFG